MRDDSIITFQVLYRPCAALPSKPLRHPPGFSVVVTVLNVILSQHPQLGMLVIPAALAVVP